MNIDRTLKEIGFEEDEIKIYLFLLKLGKSSQQSISDKTGILRQTVYDIMKKMELKGYVSQSIIGKRKIYSAIDPNILLNKIREKEDELIQIIPQLESLRNNKEVYLSSETFLDIAGLKNLFNLTLESKSGIFWFANKEISDKIFQEYYWHNYAKKRISKKIPMKLLIEPTLKKDWDTDKKSLRETRRNKMVKGMLSSFVIFDDKVIIYSMKEEQLFGVFIRNRVIKSSFENIFLNLWNKS